MVVLSGGRARRLGRDKAAVTVRGVRLIDHVLRSLPRDVPVVVVGPATPGLPADVTVTREDPPGGGPLAGLAAGLELVRTSLTAVCAVDMPFAASHLARLVTLIGENDAVVPVDDRGVRQPLGAVYRTDSLRSGLRTLGDPAGIPFRRLVDLLSVSEVRLPGDELRDIDTVADLAAARSTKISNTAAKDGIMIDTATVRGARMKDWVEAVKAELGVTAEVDLDRILDVAKDAAHGVERPAAPVTTYLLGYAVAGGADPAEAAARIHRMAEEWTPES